MIKGSPEWVDSLPENGGFNQRLELTGRNRYYPVVNEGRCLYVKPDDYVVVYDTKGQAYSTGWYEDVLYKTKMSQL